MLISGVNRGGSGGAGVSSHEVVIVGAGLAGLGAARTLTKAGITDFVILEGR
jgi:monoamine oxidase